MSTRASAPTGTESLIDELEDALASSHAEKRLSALWHVTDLFIAGADSYSEEQITLFDDVIDRLANRIEAKARAQLARRLAPVARAPRNLIKALAHDDDIAVAQPVLHRSERLDDADLVATAKAKSQQHLLAIAQRPTLSEAVTDVLVERGDNLVIRSVAKNTGARFSNNGFGTLVERSVGDDILATHVGMRRDVPRHLMLKLLERASAAVRQKLASANPRAAEEVRDVVAEIDGSIRSGLRGASADFAAAMTAVEGLHQGGQLGEAELYGFANARKFEETVVALALIAGVPIDMVERAMLNEQPDMLVILGKVAGLSWSTIQCVLVRATDRSMSAQDLDRALRGFNRLSGDTAKRIVEFYNARRGKPGAGPGAASQGESASNVVQLGAV